MEETWTVEALADLLLEKLHQAIGELDQNCTVRKVKTKDGNTETTLEIRETEPGGTVDRAGLKQLTGALKELQTIRGDMPALERREREARIESLCRGASLPEQEERNTGVILLAARNPEGRSGDTAPVQEG